MKETDSASAGIEREAIAQILTEEYPECIKRPSDAYRGADRILDAAGTEGPGLREGLERLRELSGQRLVVYTTKELDGLSIREPCRVVQVAELEATIDAALAARPVDKDEKK